jgi:cation-transporting ATPase 13A1
MFNTDNVLTRQTDAFIIIGILLFFSIISSVYILVHGLADPDRDRNKLFLRCILIITTVVPPELPMILTIAVNNSLMYLQRKKIFCTEPYRMPLAGKISVCAFDKTGYFFNIIIVL